MCLEEVKEKGDTQFLNYFVSLTHFLPFSVTVVSDLSHHHVYQKWEEKEGVARAAICPTISPVPFHKNTSFSTSQALKDGTS